MDIPIPRQLDNLPTEIYGLVFSHLDCSSLASLCRVSKSLNATVQQMLYSHLVLPLSTFDDIDRLHRLLIIRAASKIHDHTTGVTIVDSHAPLEAIPARLFQSNDPYTCSQRKVADNVEKDHSLYLLISLIPSGNLHIFRHLSSRPISSRILEYLSHFQRGLYFFQATVRSDPHYQPRFTTQFQLPYMFRDLPKLKTCDVSFFNPEGFHKFVKCITSGPFAFRSSLRNLRIQVPESETFSQILLNHVAVHDARQLHLNQLTLDGFDLKGLFNFVSQLTQVQSLTHLTLWNCLHADVFFFELTVMFLKSPRLIDLKSLTALFHTNNQDFDECLENLYKICELNSINVVWDHPLGQPGATFAAMSSLAKSLRSLSLHQKTTMHIAEDDLPYLREGLRTIFQSCRNLCQLGIQVNEYYILPQIWDVPILKAHMEFWSLLRYSPYLRILHLRQYEFCQHPRSRSEKEVAWDLERFASGLFAFLDREGYCTNLRCLVMGMRQSPIFNRAIECIPRHYFLKAKQKVGSNIETIVAVPVSLKQLQMEEPAATLLDNDPGCEWQGGRPGQFNAI